MTTMERYHCSPNGLAKMKEHEELGSSRRAGKQEIWHPVDKLSLENDLAIYSKILNVYTGRCNNSIPQ